MPVKHAELMMQYAKDAATNDKPWELWEIKAYNKGWFPLTTHPGWHPECEYRRRQFKIDLPKCVTSADEMHRGEPYYVPSLTLGKKHDVYYWEDYPDDLRHLERGLVYLDREDAIKHTDVLLSLRNA